MTFLENFINENFLIPLCHYYTFWGTITYGLILVLAVLGTYKLLKYLKINIDKKFFIGILPFIIYGGWTRALRDFKIGIYQNNLFCSPPIYFFVFLVTLISLLLGLSLERIIKKKKYSSYFKYYKVMFFIGILLLLYNASISVVKNYFGFFIILGLVDLWAAIFFGLHHLKPKLMSFENAGIITSHLFDASAAFIAITLFGFYEQHVLPGFLMNIFGPWIIFPLKIIVVWPVLAIVDRSKENKFFKKFLKIIILILGLALGLRDFLTISLLSV
jgi:uncharacterized membrane protein